jgi:hypothetical protein
LLRSRLLFDLAHLDNARSTSIGRFLVERDLDAEFPQVRRDSTQVIAEEGWIAGPGRPFRDLRLGTIAIGELEQQLGCRSMPRAALDHEGTDRSGDAIVLDQSLGGFHRTRLKCTQEGTFGCKSALACDRADHKVGHSRQSMQTGSHVLLFPQTVHKDIEHCPEYLGALRLEIVPEFGFRAPILLLNWR